MSTNHSSDIDFKKYKSLYLYFDTNLSPDNVLCFSRKSIVIYYQDYQ